MDMVFCRKNLHISIAAPSPSGIMIADMDAFLEKLPDLVAGIFLYEGYLVPYLFFLPIRSEVIRDLLCHGISRGLCFSGLLSEIEPDRTYRRGDYR